MVILSCLAKKNRNLNLRKKSSVYYWKGRFVGVSALKMQLSVINWTFFPQIQILIFLREATQNDHIRLLYKFEYEHFFLVVLGVVDMRQLLLNEHNFSQPQILCRFLICDMGPFITGRQGILTLLYGNINKRNFNPFSPNCLSLLWTFSRARTFHAQDLVFFLNCTQYTASFWSLD